MLNFKAPTIEDKKWVDECFSHSHSMNCEYTFGNTLIWTESYYGKICNYKGFFICTYGKNNDLYYSLPIGSGNFKEAMEAIFDDAKEKGIVPKFSGVTDSYKELLNKDFPDMFDYEEDRGFADYIYSTEKMANLTGKKYHGKRNHISFFKKSHPDWKFEKIDSSNIDDCIKLHQNWIQERIVDDDSQQDEYSLEFEAVLRAFENFDRLGLIGGLIRIDGKAIAYTLGEPKSKEVFVTHFEKAPADLRGAYPIINQEFTKNCLMDYKYVNREEDLNIEGLRKAKLSYEPEILLQKSVAIYKGQL